MCVSYLNFVAASRKSAEMLQETAGRVFTNAATAQNRARMVAGNAPDFKEFFNSAGLVQSGESFRALFTGLNTRKPFMSPDGQGWDQLLRFSLC